MQLIWLDQEDAALLHEGEEVTLMEWGNAIIRVHFHVAFRAFLDIQKSMHLFSSFNTVLACHATGDSILDDSTHCMCKGSTLLLL